MKKTHVLAIVAGSAAVAAAAWQSVAWAQQAEAPKPKHTIEEVMERAHGKNGLMKKVASGDATDDEKAELLDLYISMAENDPPRGDAASYQAFANKAVLGAARVVVGREGAEAQLAKSVDCMGCHRAHRPPNP
jgi:hypothetical protein